MSRLPELAQITYQISSPVACIPLPAPLFMEFIKSAFTLPLLSPLPLIEKVKVDELVLVALINRLDMIHNRQS